MTIKQLAEKEVQLLSLVIKLYHLGDTKETRESLNSVFVEYNDIFEKYVNMANVDDEALKRSLFIQWHQISEPNWLTGIPELNQEIEIKLLKILDKRIQNDLLDKELIWMFNYYAKWEYIYERFPQFPSINKFVKSVSQVHFPKVINKIEMVTRGQMGHY